MDAGLPACPSEVHYSASFAGLVFRMPYLGGSNARISKESAKDARVFYKTSLFLK
jgi:hypothetical protein